MKIHQEFIPGLAIATYIVGDEKTGDAVVIDPTRDVEPLILWARRHDLHLRHVVETHVHADFVSGARELKERMKGELTIHCSGHGGSDWTPPYADRVVHDDDEIVLGQVKLKVVHTPGHTPEHISLALYDTSRSKDTPWLMFTGDFLFVGDVGRPDLLGEEAKKHLAHQLYQSVFEKLPAYPDFTEIFPAHGAGSLCGKALGSRSSSTLGFERRFAPALQHRPEEQWVADLLRGMPLSPGYFRRMKHVNHTGPQVIGPEPPGRKRFAAKQVFENVCDQCLVLDTRSKEAFAAAHVPGAINIPSGPSLPTWAGWVLPYDAPIMLVLDRPEMIDDTVRHLLRVGFDDIRGFMEGGMDAWANAGLPIATLKTTGVLDLHQQLQHDGRDLTLLDVRTESEWNAGHIANARHIHGGILQEQIQTLPRDKPVAVVCGSGYRASIAASFLQREGFKDVTNVLGGMSGWKAAGLPVAG